MTEGLTKEEEEEEEGAVGGWVVWMGLVGVVEGAKKDEREVR